MWKQILKFIWNSESTGEMKLVWNFTWEFTISLDFEIYFLEFPWEIVFGIISGNYLCL